MRAVVLFTLDRARKLSDGKIMQIRTRRDWGKRLGGKCRWVDASRELQNLGEERDYSKSWSVCEPTHASKRKYLIIKARLRV